MTFHPSGLLGGFDRQLHSAVHWLLIEPTYDDTQLDLEFCYSTWYRNIPIPHRFPPHNLHHFLCPHCEWGVGVHISCKSGDMEVESQM